MNKRLLLPWAVLCGAVTAAALPVTQALKAFSAGKAGEIHGVIGYPGDSGAQGLEVYRPGRIFRAVLPQSGEFTLNYVPPGSHTLVVESLHGGDSVGRVILTPYTDPNSGNALGIYDAVVQGFEPVAEGVRIDVLVPPALTGPNGGIVGGSYWFFVQNNDVDTDPDGEVSMLPTGAPVHLTVH